MPRKAFGVPSYCLHKASGQAVVRIGGRDVYLGPHGSEESKNEYTRVLAECRVRREEQVAEAATLRDTVDPSMTLSEVLLCYREFAKGYYSKDGEPTKEFVEMAIALKPLRELYGATLAREFGPLKLQVVRQHMMDKDISRGVVNHRVNRIKRFIKWATSQQLIPPSVFTGISTVVGLRRGRTTARETDPVTPVDDQHVEATIPYASPQVAAMIQLQRLTGMRPCEVVMIRMGEVDRSAEVWIYSPSSHKNSWRGRDRTIPLGPKAQEVLRPFIKSDPDAFVFSPQEAEAHRGIVRRALRKTPMTPSQCRRTPKAKPKRAKRDRYDVSSYRRAITYAIEKGNRERALTGQSLIPKWFPLQLRHSRATELNEMFGIEAAAVSLGHAHADVTKVYAERNLKLAIDVARKTG